MIDFLDTLQKAWSKLDDGLKKSLGLLEPAKDIDDCINKVLPPCRFSCV